MKKNCSLCGVLIQQSQDYCETCAQMMGVSNAEPTAQTTEVQTAQSENVAPPIVMQSIQNTFEQPTESIQSNQIAANEKPTYTRPPRNMPLPNSTETVSNYKSGLLDWFWELPSIVKFGAVLVLVFIIFGGVLKLFMGMDVSVTNTTPPPANLEVQRPWFSAWFRSTPTVEEIFEKYENETSSKAKTLTSQNYYLTGNVQLLKTHTDGVVDLNFLYKNKGSATNSPVQGEMSFYNGAFEIYLQHPNKWVLKAATNFNNYSGKQQVVPFYTGFDGTKVWGLMKTPGANGNLVNQDVSSSGAVFYINSAAAGISLSFQKSLFPKAELAGDDYVFNRKSYSVKAKNVFGDETTLAFDVETGLLTKITQKDLTVYVIEHKNFDGVLYPAKIISKINGIWAMFSIEKIQPDAIFSSGVFLNSSY